MTTKEAKQAMYDRLVIEAEKKSTAERYTMSMKAIEAVIREAVYKRMKTNDYRARSAKQADIILYGKRSEIKCGGTVISGSAVINWTENDILPNKAYIVFPVIDKIFDEIDAIDNSAILTREQFLTYCEKASRKGVYGTFHITGGNNRPAVVAFQPAPLKKLRMMIWNDIQNGELETIGTYIIERQG